MAGWTVVGGFGLFGQCLVESPLYLGPWDEHRCAFAPIETINNGDSKKKKQRRKRKKKGQICYSSSVSATPLAIEISTPREIIVISIHPPLPDTLHYLSLVKLPPSHLPFSSNRQAWRACPRGWLSFPSRPLLQARLGSPQLLATSHLSVVHLYSRSIGKVVVPGGTGLWYCTLSF